VCARPPSFLISLSATTVSSQVPLRLSQAGPSRFRREKKFKNRLASLGSRSSHSSMSLLSPLILFSLLFHHPSSSSQTYDADHPLGSTTQTTHNQQLPKTRRKQTREETVRASRDETRSGHRLFLHPAAGTFSWASDFFGQFLAALLPLVLLSYFSFCIIPLLVFPLFHPFLFFIILGA
jgi:hypothetical protein